MGTFGAVAAGLLILAEQGPIVIATGPHGVSPKYHRYDYEAACGAFVFQVRFRNGPEERGRVDHVLIDGRPVRDAAATLQMRAARRGIDSIEILNCGMDSRRPVFRALMVMTKAESQAASMRHMLAFRLTREGRGEWRLVID
jgi:hypothetical protein